jgi:two-component system OmpR family sensor kinase
VAERARHDPLIAAHDVRVADGPSVVVPADERLLRRALSNLVENAAKHGASPITLAAASDDDRVVLTVTDAGAGIPAGARARVVEPFYRLDRARTPGAAAGGFGLGLAFVRRVAEAHGGALAIEDAEPHGCRVSLVLPLGHG